MKKIIMLLTTVLSLANFAIGMEKNKNFLPKPTLSAPEITPALKTLLENGGDSDDEKKQVPPTPEKASSRNRLIQERKFPVLFTNPFNFENILNSCGRDEIKKLEKQAIELQKQYPDDKRFSNALTAITNYYKELAVLKFQLTSKGIDYKNELESTWMKNELVKLQLLLTDILRKEYEVVQKQNLEEQLKYKNQIIVKKIKIEKQGL